MFAKLKLCYNYFMKTKQQTICLCAFLTFFVIFFVLALLVIFNNNWLITTDNNVASFFANNRQPFFNYLFVIASFVGQTATIAVLCLILLLLPNRKNLGIPVAIITITSALLNFLIKIVVARARPDGYFLTTNVLGYKMPTGYSFPSGHAQTASVFYISTAIFTLKYLKKDWQKILLLTLAITLCLVICFARIYLAVHFLSDVLAGLSLGLFVVFAGIFMAQHISPKVLNIY